MVVLFKNCYFFVLLFCDVEEVKQMKEENKYVNKFDACVKFHLGMNFYIGSGQLKIKENIILICQS